jgi:taurine--2-oxoglutarate transaminase
MSDLPFFVTWAAQRSAKTVEITGGEGVWFTTSDGGRWLDMASLSYQANLGHGHRKVMEAVQRQAGELCLTTPSAVFPAKVEVAERLLALAPPGFSKVFFTLGGAEANENALKIARMVTGRHKLVSRYRSYHGATMGALTLSGDYRRPPLEPGIPGVVHVLDCYEETDPHTGARSVKGGGSAEQLGRILDLEGARSVAAVFLEPVPGANGVLVPPKGYWEGVREACDRHGTLLVADEVLTGFGRTGKWFGFQHHDVVPDMITVGKGLTAGYGVLGAVLVHERVARHFEEHVLYAGLTHYAHPLGCAAAAATLRAYEDEGLIERAAALERPLLEGLTAIGRRLGARAKAVRGQGLLAALELDASAEQWRAIQAGLDARRVMTHNKPKDGTLIVSPPLCVSEAELAQGLGWIEEALVEAC